MSAKQYVQIEENAVYSVYLNDTLHYNHRLHEVFSFFLNLKSASSLVCPFACVQACVQRYIRNKSNAKHVLEPMGFRRYIHTS